MCPFPILFRFQIQIFGFNSQLYTNFSEALHKAQGIVVVSLLLQVNPITLYFIDFCFSFFVMSTPTPRL